LRLQRALDVLEASIGRTKVAQNDATPPAASSANQSEMSPEILEGENLADGAEGQN
jgi:hypothetical protein